MPKDAPVLILLPGLLCDAAVWAGQQEALAGARCLVPDYAACSTITRMAQRVLEQAPSARFALAGHSMGGRVALEVMRLAPERVDRLALLDTGLDPVGAGEAGISERDQRMALLRLAREQGMRAMGRQWAKGMVHPARLGSPLFDTILDMIDRKSPDMFEAQIGALLARPDARPVFSGIRCPTLLVCGRQDAWSPLARHQQMQALLPAARLEVIEESGHMAPMERPHAVSAALARWLDMTGA